jgi:hypothetical protein
MLCSQIIDRGELFKLQKGPYEKGFRGHSPQIRPTLKVSIMVIANFQAGKPTIQPSLCQKRSKLVEMQNTVVSKLPALLIMVSIEF